MFDRTMRFLIVRLRKRRGEKIFSYAIWNAADYSRTGGIATQRFVAKSARRLWLPSREESMPERLLGRIGDFLQARRPWYKLPRLLAMPQLVEIRNQLRRENLHDTEEPPLEKKAVPAN